MAGEKKTKRAVWFEYIPNKNTLMPIKGKQQVGVICLGGCIANLDIAANYIPLGLLPILKDDHIELWLNDDEKK